MHTPGPWFVDLHSGPGAPLVRREDGHPICLLESVRTGAAERPVANARLIAAAPDLLEAAKDALAELYRISPSRASPKLRAAIAKATLPQQGGDPK